MKRTRLRFALALLLYMLNGLVFGQTSDSEPASEPAQGEQPGRIVILGSRPVQDPARNEATQTDQGDRRTGRLRPVDPREPFSERDEESAPIGRLVPVDVSRFREEPTIHPLAELDEQAVLLDRLVAFSLLLAATLPVVGVAYALGLVLIRDSNLSWAARFVGFLLSWQMAGLAALLMAPGPAAADAIPAAVSSGLGGAVLGLLSIAIVGRRPVAADEVRSPVTPHSERPAISRRRLTRVGSERLTIAGAAMALILTLLFPPFVLVLDTMTINLGFGFLFDPPMWGNSAPGTVNVPFLLTEWVAMGIFAGLAWLFARSRCRQ